MHRVDTVQRGVATEADGYFALRGRPRPRFGRDVVETTLGSCAGLKSEYLAM